MTRILLLLLLLTCPALAQQTVQTRPGDGGLLWFDAANRATIPGQLLDTGGVPVLTTCGTSPTIVGTDLSGMVTMGTGSPTGCIITFAAAYPVAPHCVVGWATAPLAAMAWTTTTTALTLVQTATSSNVVHYVCFGKR